jgi:hypothetical protein
MIKKKLPIRLVNYGVANNFGTHIEMHRDLTQYPELWKAILEHERSHSSKGYKFKDFKIDFMPQKDLKSWEIIKFMSTRPKTWIQMLPFYYIPKQGWIYDINKIIKYSLMLLLFSTIYFMLLNLKGGIKWVG